MTAAGSGELRPVQSFVSIGGFDAPAWVATKSA